MAFFMLEGLFAMILFHQAPTPSTEIYDIGYWGMALGLACLLIIVALADVREELNNIRSSRIEALRNLFDEEERQKQ